MFTWFKRSQDFNSKYQISVCWHFYTMNFNSWTINLFQVIDQNSLIAKKSCNWWLEISFDSTSRQYMASQVALVVMNPICQCKRRERRRCNPWVGKIPCTRTRQPTPIFLPGESVDRGAWWATVHWVARSQTRLKRLSTHSHQDNGDLYQKKKRSQA